MITAHTFSFLKDLNKNNTREWMLANKARYEIARKEFEELVAALIIETAKFDKSISHIIPKECIFRLNRDVRFSKEKTPYKTHFGAYICAKGRKSSHPGYYLHIEPGKCFAGGGNYMPMPDELQKIRQEIDYNAKEWKSILSKATFKKIFGTVQGDRLKTAPKGYEKDHPMLEYLQLKQFYVMCSITDAEIQSTHAPKTIVKVFKEQVPLNEFLIRAVE